MTIIAIDRPLGRHAAPNDRSRRGLFAWLRSWGRTQPVELQDTRVPLGVAVLPPPSQENRQARTDQTGAPLPPPPVHPPFAHRPAQHTHVAIRMQRILVEASWDPELTPTKLWNSIGPLVEELRQLAETEQDQHRRMERNQAAVAAQRVLLEDAALRGVPDTAVVEQAADGILGRAVHVAAEESTGVLPAITEETPDPRTVAQPRDVNPGDVEPDQTPVCQPEDPMPLPTEEFVGGAPRTEEESDDVGQAQGERHLAERDTEVPPALAQPRLPVRRSRKKPNAADEAAVTPPQHGLGDTP